ncbi:MAG TPA: hypothetical protein VM011_12085 [Gammaproteobacteria bacterium]|nr:hypothetical protein [Gammaproteobacteria bacterium]
MRIPMNLNGVLAIMLAVPVSIQAAEWSAEPRISLRTGYNDNIRLRAADHDSVWETALSPSVKFGVAKEHQGLSGDAGFAIRRFTGGSGLESSDILDREDYHLNTAAFHNTLRDSFKANLDYTLDSTLDTELDETGNVIQDRATRERLSLGPSWTRTLTELTSLELAYDYSNVEYSDDPGANLVDNKYHVTSASLIRQLTPRMQATLAAGYSSYRPDTDFDSDTLSLQAGLSRNFSETLVASFLVGQRQTTSDSQTFVFPIGLVNTEIETSSPVYSASISKTLETGSLGASLSRSSSPGGNGELLDATRLALTGDYKLSETFSTSLRIEYTENETIVSRGGAVAPNQDKETFFRVTPRASWRWRREWELAGEYQYAENDDPTAGKATRNAVYATLTYRPVKISVSR